MRVLRVHNVNEALPLGLLLLDKEGDVRESRNGAVHVMSEPVTTVYKHPNCRVIFDPVRDANPFFHLFESLWMLGGRNDLKYVERFAKNMRSYSDDGITMWGAYGWRWRSFFATDQLDWIINRLKATPSDRRCVLQMWCAERDTAVASDGGKDVPCNVTTHFQINAAGMLDMTVFNRSNDIIWGAYGANAVHFSVLLEYMAASIGVPVGRYWQVSDNYHAYEGLYDKLLPQAQAFDEFAGDPYTNFEVEIEPLVSPKSGREIFDQDLVMFLDEPDAVGFRNRFFRKVAKPMYMAHRAFKENKGLDKFVKAKEILEQMPEKNDWRRACEEWLGRRLDRWNKEADDGVAHDR